MQFEINKLSFQLSLILSSKVFLTFYFSPNENKRSLSNLDERARDTNDFDKHMAPWLFSKKTIGSILESAGFLTNLLYMPNSDFSLSVSYLQQTLASLQTVLRYRSPYSNQFDSIVAFNPMTSDATTGDFGTRPGHHRGISIAGNNSQLPNSANINQMGAGGTPRRSLDDETNTDDGTSYDSVSQISVDQQGFELVDSKVKFYTDLNVNDNQNTVNSLNFLRMQQQQASHESSSFDIIKRVLFNDNRLGYLYFLFNI